MKAKTVNEIQDFERGQDPKKAMGIGIPRTNEFLVISLDSMDQFMDASDPTNADSLMVVEGPMSYDKANAKYGELAGSVSNVYLANVIKSDISI